MNSSGATNSSPSLSSANPRRLPQSPWPIGLRAWPGWSWRVANVTAIRCNSQPDYCTGSQRNQVLGRVASEIMQHRLSEGRKSPFGSSRHRMRAFDLGSDPRKALGPAVMSTAQTGRTHDSTQPKLQNQAENSCQTSAVHT